MIRLNSDYLEGGHPLILEALMATNLQQTPGYGEDSHCAEAVRLIQVKCRAPGADVHFIPTGTGANKTIIASALKPYEGVISADTGHINVHETGAVESTGHKVLTVKAIDGKLTCQDVEKLITEQADNEHTVKPGMLYISQPTEMGTLYSLYELRCLSDACRRLGIYLFMDGARLGYGLAAPGNDVSLEDICRLCDVFTIGGTKVGALFGEAVVITNKALSTRFRYMIKQQGLMLAKGRILGIQFETLMRDNLYETISGHAVSLARRIRQALLDKNIPLLVDSPTNQLFPVFSNEKCLQLASCFVLETWQAVSDQETAVRVCTSWATTPEQADAFIAAI
ncbi:MAG: aminotransferase class I/II-fold pyridoxal phosphate-dependent enzyme [Clostridia bacterium]|nr:aminotransferase class I/II-fold pyridoxal phosphate-dependent enzyme [Clostridia bacterium]